MLLGVDCLIMTVYTQGAFVLIEIFDDIKFS